MSKSESDTGDEVGGLAEVQETRFKLDEAHIEELAEKMALKVWINEAAHEMRAKLDDGQMDELAERIASKVWIKKEEKDEREKKELVMEDWEEGSEFLLCRPCSQNRYADMEF